MIKRTDVDEEMLNELKVIAGFDCKRWICEECPLYSLDVRTGCASLEVKQLLKNYYDGKELIY